MFISESKLTIEIQTEILLVLGCTSSYLGSWHKCGNTFVLEFNDEKRKYKHTLLIFMGKQVETYNLEYTNIIYCYYIYKSNL